MRLNRPIRRAGFVLDFTLDSTEEKGEKVDIAKMISLMDNPSHPLHETAGHRSYLVTGLVTVLHH